MSPDMSDTCLAAAEHNTIMLDDLRRNYILNPQVRALRCDHMRQLCWRHMCICVSCAGLPRGGALEARRACAEHLLGHGAVELC